MGPSRTLPDADGDGFSARFNAETEILHPLMGWMYEETGERYEESGDVNVYRDPQKDRNKIYTFAPPL